MVRDLAAATAAYRSARAAIEPAKAEAKRVVDQAQADLRAARREMYVAIAEAYRGGARQVDIIRTTGLSRERVRLILRQQGIEPED